MAFESLGGYGKTLAGLLVNDSKQQETAVVADQKKSEMSAQNAYINDLQHMHPNLLAAKYGDKALEDRQDFNTGVAIERNYQNHERSGQEIMHDAAVSLDQGAVGLVGGLYGGALALGNVVSRAGQHIGTDEQRDFFRRQETELAQHAARYGAFLSKINSRLNGELSDDSQMGALGAGLQGERNETENQAKRDQDVANGMNSHLADGLQTLRGAISGAKNLAADPAYMANFVTQQVPSLALGPLSKLAAIRSVTAGLTAAETKDLLLSAAGKEMVEKQGTRNLMTSIGVTEGTGASQQTFDQVMQMKPEDLQKNSQEYRELIQQNYSPEDARAVVAQRAANTALAIQGPAAALTGKIAARFELSPMSGGGATGAGRVLHALSGMGKETVEEALQSGSGQLAQNIGVQQHADETQSLTKGVGEQAGMGAIAAVGLSGAVQAPSAAAGTAVVTANATTDLAKKGAAYAKDKLQDFVAKRTKLNGETQAAADADAQSQTVEAAAQEYARAEPQADDSAQAAEPEQPAPLPEEEAIAAQQPVPQTATPAGKDRLTKFGRLYDIMSSPHIESVSPDNQMQLAANAFQALQGMVAERNQLVQKLEENPDDAVAQKRADALTKAIQSDAAVQVSAYAKENSAALG
ncbi:hypothetical protein [Pantoea eucrina]|uniref:hypothetical protein n=1 Tax=Pantoea eucrina TaxID=472693 RepID=UPI00080F4A1A|nr:hypothetical protein [Pantoea eucrina]